MRKARNRLRQGRDFAPENTSFPLFVPRGIKMRATNCFVFDISGQSSYESRNKRVLVWPPLGPGRTPSKYRSSETPTMRTIRVRMLYVLGRLH